MNQKQTESLVNIIGGGVSGLTCAHYLKKAGRKVRIIEASSRVGGRLRTDQFQGYRLDHGFQVLLTSYPEVKRVIDYKQLPLVPFYPGALIRSKASFHRIANPFQQPLDGITTIFNSIGTLSDKLKIACMKLKILSTDSLSNSTSTLNALKFLGFSDSIKDQLWMPLLRGVFLEPELLTSVRKFEEVFRHFMIGQVAVPYRGMYSIINQLAACLEDGEIYLNTPVERIDRGSIRFKSGHILPSRLTVLAVDHINCSQLIGHTLDHTYETGVTCLYYGMKQTSIPSATLILNGSGSGPINNLAVLPKAADYAPKDMTLLCVSVIDPRFIQDAFLEQSVNKQLTAWYGNEVKEWRHLKSFRIENPVPCMIDTIKPIETRIDRGLYRCGDYMGVSSLNTAMKSGREAAEAILKEY